MPASSEAPSAIIDSKIVDPSTFRAALANFVPKDAPASEQIAAIEAGLRSPAGKAMRDTMAQWIVDSIVPVARLVPQAYENWRPPVRDAMMFVVAVFSLPVSRPNSWSDSNSHRKLPPKSACCA